MHLSAPKDVCPTLDTARVSAALEGSFLPNETSLVSSKSLDAAPTSSISSFELSVFDSWQLWLLIFIGSWAFIAMAHHLQHRRAVVGPWTPERRSAFLRTSIIWFLSFAVLELLIRINFGRLYEAKQPSVFRYAAALSPFVYLVNFCGSLVIHMHAACWQRARRLCFSRTRCTTGCTGRSIRTSGCTSTCTRTTTGLGRM